MYPVICNVKGIFEYDNEIFEDYIIIFADNLKDAGEQIDKFYGKDADTVSFHFLENGPLTINKEIAEKILNGDI